MTQAPYIDLDLATEMVEKAVRSKGENYVYVKPSNYVTCAYSIPTDAGYKRCIIGEALFLAGIVENDQWYENLGINTQAGTVKVAEELQAQGLISGYDDDAVSALNDAQRIQDDGGTWGEAFKMLKESIRIMFNKEEA